MTKLGLPAEQLYHEKPLKTVGIYSRNREEWIFTDIACWMMTIVSIPLYDTLGEESMAWTFDQTELSTVFLSSENLKNILAFFKKGRTKTLKNIVCFDDLTPEEKTAIEEAGLKGINMSEVIELGKANPDIPLKPCTGDDIMTICYTSGTTGKAKGVVITHLNFRNDAASALLSGIVNGYKVGFGTISYLPFAHTFERVTFYMGIVGGFRMAFYHGSLAELKDDVVLAKPNIMIGVPRVFGRFYSAISSSLRSLGGFKRKLIETAMATKLDNYHKTGAVNHWLYDTLVLSNIRNSFGGSIATFVSAAAPMDPVIMETIKLWCSCCFIQGYGLTETCGPTAISYDDDTYPGSNGPPMACSVVKVVDVPEMDYYSTDMIDGKLTPRGELCVKGSNAVKEYFKDPERTVMLYDSEGWLHTGDIALLNSAGCIRIIDRRKNIFKLSQGEYIAPEKIENTLANSPWIMQQFIYGDSFQSYLIAVIVPNQGPVMRWAKENNIEGTYEKLCEDPKLNAEILTDLTRLSRDKKVYSY